MLFQAKGAEVRVFKSGRQSFYIKAYLFTGLAGDRQNGDC
jgi:HKD family nuclease